MPYRLDPPVTGHYYHVYNRGIDGMIMFKNKRDYVQFVDLINYYRFSNPPIKFSKVLSLTEKNKKKLWVEMKDSNKEIIKILCFCLMNNHFHLLLQQLNDSGITNFMRIVQNAYARYFNIKYQRKGRLIQSEYKYKTIETDEQLDETSRYIHLNPVEANIIKVKNLNDYSYSSFQTYLGVGNYDFIGTSTILSRFYSTNSYESFVVSKSKTTPGVVLKEEEGEED